MAASTKTVSPTEIKLHQVSQILELTYSDGKNFHLPADILCGREASRTHWSTKNS